MQLGFTKNQVIDTLKVIGYVAVSAVLDYLISQTTGTQFGVLTPIINIVLVTLKNFIKKDTSK